MPSEDSPTRRIDPDDNRTVRGLAAGTRVFGRYVLESQAGRGGMGVVWKARDERLERVVALKLLPEVVAGDPEAVRDLLRETKRCLELTHPNIVRVYDLVQDGTLAAISMEYVDGGSLATRKAAAPGGCLTLGKLRPLTAQLCAAMDYAHRVTKVVHRDLKPANLLLTQDGQLKVTDFGIARSLSDTRTRLTGRVDNASGTLLYMSPQQLRGADPAASDDIYALGATLYELLTGWPPFHTGDVAWQIREAEPKPVNARLAALGRKPVPAAWEETILACLAKEPGNRPNSAGEVARRLRITRRGAGKVGSDLRRAVSARADAGPALAISNPKPSIVVPVSAFDDAKADAENGDASAQCFLGWMYWLGDGVPKDIAEAVKWYRKAADQGDSLGQFALGLMYAAGDGVPKDSAEAVKWYRKAADQGNAAGQSNLGLMYANGTGVGKDSAEAAKWYRKAADQGYAAAQYNLGRMYANGDGVAKDSVEAVKWYRKAADSGDAEAQFSLGLIYALGDWVPKDGTEAARLFRKAADQGNAQAQYCLGLMYDNGIGVAVDETEAVAWYKMAAGEDCDEGDRYALELLLCCEMTLTVRELLKEIDEVETRQAGSFAVDSSPSKSIDSGAIISTRSPEAAP